MRKHDDFIYNSDQNNSTNIKLDIPFSFSPRLKAEDLIRYLEGKGYVRKAAVKSDSYRVYYLEGKEESETLVPMLDKEKEYELRIIPFFYQIADHDNKSLISIFLDIAKKSGRSLKSGDYVFLY